MKLDDAAVMAAFEKRKTAHWIAVGVSAVFLVGWLFVVEALAGRFPAMGRSPLYFSAAMLGGDLPWLVAMLVFVRKNWRCPACDGRLPLSGVSGGLRIVPPRRAVPALRAAARELARVTRWGDGRGALMGAGGGVR